jgi:hypothetical protein
MKEQLRQFVWKEQEKLFKQAIRVKDSYGNYSVLLFPDERYVILDRKNLTFLLPSSGLLYTLPDDWKQWFKRGFIVISVPIIFNDIEYYIFSLQDKRLITKGKNIRAYTFLQGQSNYFIVRNDDLKETIFDKSGKQISDWYNQIKRDGLVDGKSDYYIAEKNGKEAIFYKDGKQITGWFDWIVPFGLVDGQSEYYIAKEDDKEAIFNKDGKQITDWFDHIYQEGLVTGESNYYIAEENNKYAIFHKDGQQITDWYDYIYPYGFVNNRSDYYIVEKDDKEAIFHKDGYQVSDWIHRIDIVGLVFGTSEYYIGENGMFYYIYRLGSKKSMGPFSKIQDPGFIFYPFENTVTLMTLDGQQKIFTKQEVSDFFEEKESENER